MSESEGERFRLKGIRRRLHDDAGREAACSGCDAGRYCDLAPSPRSFECIHDGLFILWGFGLETVWPWLNTTYCRL